MGPSRPCHDCAESGQSVPATENLGMRARNAKGDRVLGLFCSRCAAYRLGKGREFDREAAKANPQQREQVTTTPRSANFAAGHGKNEPGETFYQPSLFDE